MTDRPSPTATCLVLGDDGGESARRQPKSRIKRVRNRLMDRASSLLSSAGLYGTQGSFDAWCDSHGRWDR